MAGRNTPDTSGPMSKSDRVAGVSAVIVESPRPRVSIEIERMTKGPAKVSVRIDGDSSTAVAEETFSVYSQLTAQLAALEAAQQEDTT